MEQAKTALNDLIYTFEPFKLFEPDPDYKADYVLFMSFTSHMGFPFLMDYPFVCEGTVFYFYNLTAANNLFVLSYCMMITNRRIPCRRRKK